MSDVLKVGRFVLYVWPPLDFTSPAPRTVNVNKNHDRVKYISPATFGSSAKTSTQQLVCLSPKETSLCVCVGFTCTCHIRLIWLGPIRPVLQCESRWQFDLTVWFIARSPRSLEINNLKLKYPSPRSFPPHWHPGIQGAAKHCKFIHRASRYMYLGSLTVSLHSVHHIVIDPPSYCRRRTPSRRQPGYDF